MTLQTVVDLCRARHANQFRKYTDEKYEGHLAEVAGIFVSFTDLLSLPVPLWFALSVAWAHDLIEDQGETRENLNAVVPDLGEYVQWLTDIETGTRFERHAAKCIRLSLAPGWIQSLKVCDLASNAKSIFVHDSAFAPTYYTETRDMIRVMTGADHNVVRYLVSILDEYADKRRARGLPSCEDVIANVKGMTPGSLWRIAGDSASPAGTIWSYLRWTDGLHILHRLDKPSVVLRITNHKFKTKATPFG